MNPNRHPAGTSLGGKFAPGAAGEVSDTLADDTDLTAEDRSMAGARRVLDGGEFGGDLSPAINAMNRDEDHGSVDRLIKYQGVRSLNERQVVDVVDRFTGKKTRIGEVTDDETRPLTTGIVDDTRHDSIAYGVSRHDDGSYRVRVLIESDVNAEVTTGDRTTMTPVRVNTLVTDRVEATGDPSRDSDAIIKSMDEMIDHRESRSSSIYSAAHDYAGDGGEDEVTREFTFDPEVGPNLSDDIDVIDR